MEKDYWVGPPVYIISSVAHIINLFHICILIYVLAFLAEKAVENNYVPLMTPIYCISAVIVFLFLLRWNFLLSLVSQILFQGFSKHPLSFYACTIKIDSFNERLCMEEKICFISHSKWTIGIPERLADYFRSAAVQ